MSKDNEDANKDFYMNEDFYLSKDQIKNYKNLSKQGDIKASIKLYSYYADFEGNLKEAIVWLRKAAESGDAESQYNLGISLLNDDKDQSEALMWINKAAKQEYKPAIKALQLIKKNEMP